MPEAYEWALFFHLLGVFLVAGSSTTFIVILSMMRRAQSVQDLRVWANLAAIVDKVMPVSALVLLVTGFWLVQESPYEWGDGWVNVSFIGLILIGVMAVLVITRKIVAIDTAAADAPDGAVPQVLAAQITDPVMFGAAHAATLGFIAIIWNMTTKPGDAQAGIVLLAALLIGAASAAPMVQRQQAILERKQ